MLGILPSHLVRTPFQTVSELYFSRLRAKGVGYARHPSAQTEAIDAYPTGHDDTAFGFVRATVLRTRLATRPGVAGRRDPPSREEDRKLRPARGDGFKPTEKRFHCYHRLLSHASSSSVEASRILLRSLVEAFVPEGPPVAVVGIDETLERRYGKKIAAKGVYRDPVRSTHENFVKSSGLRWVGAMPLVPIPWASRVRAWPSLSALAPSELYAPPSGAEGTRR